MISTHTFTPLADCGFRIEFRHRQRDASASSFPCDASGNVDMDQLTEALRRDYLFARIVAREECVQPAVVPIAFGGNANRREVS